VFIYIGFVFNVFAVNSTQYTAAQNVYAYLSRIFFILAMLKITVATVIRLNRFDAVDCILSIVCLNLLSSPF